MKNLILTDNPYACELARELDSIHHDIDIFQSPNGRLKGIEQLNVCIQTSEIIKHYGLVISIHCKQLFPTELVRAVRCINVHPGFNPRNRGWFPQVFSILNGMTAGATIHEIDDELDHGLIIAQKEYQIMSWDTSGSAYRKIMEIERELLLEHYVSIRQGTYHAWKPSDEGNVNYKRDFEKLRKIDLAAHGSYREFLNHLRALTHDDYRNCYFIDESGMKIFVRVMLEPDTSLDDGSKLGNSDA